MMHRRTRFRALVVAWALLYGWWTALPYTAWKQPEAVREALQYSGRGALLPPSELVADLFVIGALAAAIGLLFFRRWGRMLLAGTTLVSVMHAPLAGVGVSGPVDGTVGFVMTLLNGALLALAYASPVARDFTATADAPIEQEPPTAPDDEELVTVFETSDGALVPVIHSLLQSAGIEFRTDSEALQDLIDGGRLAGYNAATGGVRFRVRQSDALLAKDVLELDRRA
jgi:hypothetical protein